MEKPNSEQLFEKNYLRRYLRLSGNKPIIISCKYKRIWDKHVTFSCVRPYIRGQHTSTLCNHINILRSEVEKVYNLSDFVFNRTYYIVCRSKQYEYDESRMGIELASDIIANPILNGNEFRIIEPSILQECYQFDPKVFHRK